MKRTRFLLTVAVLLLPTIHLSATFCQLCQYNAERDQYACANDCTNNGEGCGGCCHLNPGHTECFVGGCCLYNPQSGGLCYDQTGIQCGNFGCQKPGLPALADDQTAAFKLSIWKMDRLSPVLPMSSPANPETLLSEVNWVANKDFPEVISKYSRSFAQAIASFQHILADRPNQSMKEYGTLKFSAILRPHFPAEITVTHAGGSDWVVHLDRADTQSEGPLAPNILEIVDNKWTLVSHLPHPSTTPPQRHVVATGTVQ
jgi:hypothetical protein